MVISQRGGFEDARFFCGSGIKIEGNSIRCCSASHAIEKIFMIRNDKSIFLSNSVPFILTSAGACLDSKINQYEMYFCSIIDGQNKCKRNIPLANGYILEQYFVSDICINNHFEVKVERKKPLSDFTDFNDYYSHMLDDLKSIANNAKSNARVKQFGIISTISSGYDSCACATVAKKIGCSKVVSLRGGKYDLDDGSCVAEQLGYSEVIKRDQVLYRAKPGCIDAEYVCSGELGTNLQFCVFEDLFAENIVFMGMRGDYYWGKKTFNCIDNDFELKDYSFYSANIGYIENALKNGYVLIPLPTYGASVEKSIKQITLSNEMQPWCLNNDYDRPIPRRIVETAGVTRESFGYKKAGGGFAFGYDSKATLKKKMSEEGYKDFISFQKNTKKTRRSFKRSLNQIRYTVVLFPTYLNVLLRKLGISIRVMQKVTRIANPGTPSDLIFWGIDTMMRRYD